MAWPLIENVIAVAMAEERVEAMAEEEARAMAGRRECTGGSTVEVAIMEEEDRCASSAGEGWRKIDGIESRRGMMAVKSDDVDEEED